MKQLQLKLYSESLSCLIHIPAHVGGVPVYILFTHVSVASPPARPNPLAHVYVAVEPSNVPPRVAIVASFTAGGDPQSAERRSHSQNVFQYCAHSTTTTHMAIGNFLCNGELLPISLYSINVYVSVGQSM